MVINMKAIDRATFDKLKKEFWDDMPDEDMKTCLQNLIEVGIFTEDEIIQKFTNYFDIYDIKEDF